MDYTIIVNGRSYDLPKKTLDVMEKLDNVLKVDSIKGFTVRQKFEKLHEFIKDLVGAENASEMFGSDNINGIDLSELTLAVKMVCDAYDKPVNDYDIEKRKRAFDSLPIEKIVSITKARQAAQNMPANSK